MDLKKYKVYCHTNKINGKQYIGVTMQPLKKRFQYGNGYRTCHHFNRAIRKYGWESFETTVLFDELNKEQAEEKEVFLIHEMGTLSPNGYNLEGGGGLKKEILPSTRLKLSKANGRNINLYDEYGILLHKSHSASQLARDFNIERVMVQKCANREMDIIAKKYITRWEDDIQFTDIETKRIDIKKEWSISINNINNNVPSNNGRPVKCITTGVEFESIIKASEYYGIDSSSLCRVCKGIQYSCGVLDGEKLVWRYL